MPSKLSTLAPETVMECKFISKKVEPKSSAYGCKEVQWTKKTIQGANNTKLIRTLKNGFRITLASSWLKQLLIYI